MPDQVQEAYFLLSERIHCVAVDSENTQATMRCRQWYADPRADAHFLCPFSESRKAPFGVPVGGMQRIPAAYSLPQRQLFDWQIRPIRDGSFTPNLIFDFLGILLKDDEVKVIKLQEVADFIREGASQFLRFAARSDRFTDAQHSFIAVAVALRRNDELCIH